MLGTSLDSVLRLVSSAKRQLVRAGTIFVAVWLASISLPLLDPAKFWPPNALAYFTNSVANGMLVWSERSFLPRGETIIALGPWDTFTVLMEIGAAVAILAVVPYLTVEAYRNGRRALRRRERRALRTLLPLSVGLFATGAALATWLLPWLYQFAYSVQAPAGVSGTVSLTSFVTETLLFVVGLGVAFETPVVTYGLGYLGILTTALMRKNLKWAFLACTIAALFLSPGIGGGIVEVPLAFGLFGLYMMGYLMVRHTERSRDRVSWRHGTAEEA